jgi:predicted AAA+ superfamily ATPase
MKRQIPTFFQSWKDAQSRKPLILKGARQVGKTTLLKSWGTQAFAACHYFNFERDRSLHKLFEESSDPEKIIGSLSLASQRAIQVDRDLILFDEIQECPKALTSLKYFSEDKPHAYIACAGSLIGITLAAESFPVGKVEIHALYPLSFREFLVGIGRADLEKEIFSDSPVGRLAFTLEKAQIFFKHYLVTGGLPEIVQTYIDLAGQTDFERFTQVREKQKDLIETYENDMAKHAGKLNSMHIRRVWQDIPKQLSKLNSKFQFRNVIPGKRSYADLSGPIDWLNQAGLVLSSYIVNETQVPLKSFIQHNQFRLYSFDVGILGALADFPPAAILEVEKGDMIFKGHFLENFVAQTLHHYGYSLQTWMQYSSEIEFLIQTARGEIVPIEVKSRRNSKAKSLKVFLERNPSVLHFAVFSLDLKVSEHHSPLCLAEKWIQNSCSASLATLNRSLSSSQ